MLFRFMVLYLAIALVCQGDARPVLRIALEQSTRESPPLHWYDQLSQVRVGVREHILTNLFGQQGYDIEIVNFDLESEAGSKRYFEAIASGDIDVSYFVNNLSTNSVMKKVPTAFLKLKYVIVRLGSDSRGTSNIDDILDQTGAISTERTRQALVSSAQNRRGFTQLKLQSHGQREQAFEQLIAMNADYLIERKAIAHIYSRTLYQDIDFTIGNDSIFNFDIYLGFSKHSRHLHLLPATDQLIKQLHTSNEYQRINTAYMSKYINYYILKKTEP